MTSFSYDLPLELIAQRPVSPADSSSLLVVDRIKNQVADYRFSDLCSVLGGKGTLVVNDSKVIPARLSVVIGSKEAEVFLLYERAYGVWECTGRPLKKLKTCESFFVKGTSIVGRVIDQVSARIILVEFFLPDKKFLREKLFASGSMPIPPYIRGGRGDEQDKQTYQSLFAACEGSIAASTASLHFTPSLVAALLASGVEVLSLTLHMGLASISPIEGQAPASERFSVSEALLTTLRERRTKGHPIIAVGTSVVRALESTALGIFEGETELFITPKHSWKVVDGLITNFHAPGTTHLLLVESLLGRDLLSKAYVHALSVPYRFLSYGDSMCILPSLG